MSETHPDSPKAEGDPLRDLVTGDHAEPSGDGPEEGTRHGLRPDDETAPDDQS